MPPWQSKTIAVSLTAPKASGSNPQTKGDNDITIKLLCSILDTDKKDENAVLFLPFWGGSDSTFQRLMLHLQSRSPGATYISVSYAGTGGMPMTVDDTPEIHSIIPRAQQVLQMLLSPEVKARLLFKRLFLCAHSMSAKIAYILLSMLAKANLEFEVQALILLGPAPIGPLYLSPQMREQQLHAYDSFESAKWTVENVLSSRKLDETVLEHLAKDCINMSSGAKQGWLKHGMVFDCAEYLNSIRTKWPAIAVKVILGEHDKVERVDQVVEKTVEPLKKIGFAVSEKVIKGCGHLLPVEAVEEVAEILSELL